MELTKDAVRTIVARFIEAREKLGESAGGSGHFGYTSYEIEEISDPEEFRDKGRLSFKVNCKYALVIETEFTYYPDNPPYRIPKEADICFDHEGTIIQ